MKSKVACLVVTSIAVVGLAGCGSSSSSSAPADTPAATAATTTASTTAAIDAKALFVSGNVATGAAACGSCHTLGAAGTTGTIGPDLDKIAPDDNAAALSEMITDPDAEIVEGYTKGVMPADYATTLTPAEVSALATYIDEESAHAE